MFEFEDSKLGKVKVVNVTEARQYIATIMNDKDCTYIITKNNKPIRSIVNCSEMPFFGAAIPSSAPMSASESIEPRKSLKGLLKTRAEELKSQSGAKFQPPPPAVAKKVVNAPQMPSQFSTPSRMEAPPPPVPAPRGDDYFARFRKLYESPQRETPPPPPPPPPSPQPPAQVQVQTQTEALAPSPTSAPAAEEFVEMEISGNYFDESANFEGEGSLLEAPEEELSVEADPKEIPGDFKPAPTTVALEPAPASVTLPTPPSHSEHPSIDDLLKELAEERLSGEEEDLEIDSDVQSLLKK